LLDKKYGRAVDWWAFGVLIYQMLLQQSPFRGEDEDEIYDAILADEPLYPIHMPRDSVSILQKLLTREPDQRLGSGPTDAQEVMSQPFFRNINWDDIYHKRVQPAFKPTIKNATDTSNFDSEFTSVTPVLTPVQSGKSGRTRQSQALTDLLQCCRKPCRKSSVAFRTRRTLSRRRSLPRPLLRPMRVLTGGLFFPRTRHTRRRLGVAMVAQVLVSKAVARLSWLMRLHRVKTCLGLGPRTRP